MDDQKRQEYLNDHIPYRMRSIDMLRFACEVLISQVKPTKVEILFDSRPVLIANSVYFITNPFLELGTLFCRAMLEFLGIKCNQSKRSLIMRKNRSDRSPKLDLVIEEFGLNKIGPEEAVNVPFEKNTDKVEEALVSTILLAHKGIAHFTVDPVNSAGIGSLHLCSKAVPWLICRHLYDKLGLPEPNYELA